MLHLIIVEVGKKGEISLYRFLERQSNGTYRVARNLPDGGPNEPMLFRDAKTRMALMYSHVQRGSFLGTGEEEE